MLSGWGFIDFILAYVLNNSIERMASLYYLVPRRALTCNLVILIWHIRNDSTDYDFLAFGPRWAAFPYQLNLCTNPQMWTGKSTILLLKPNSEHGPLLVDVQI